MNELDYESFFSFSKDSSKYKIQLTKAIKFLLSKQRVIEAKHHFNELERINPNHSVVMDLGFEIGTKTFDREMVLKYHNLLEACKKYNKHDLFIKRITFWISINEISNSISDSEELLNDLTLDKVRLLELYRIINHEIKDENLIIMANTTLKKRKLRITRR